jgi:hypothetical protein
MLTSLLAAVTTAEFASLSVNAGEPDLASAMAPTLDASTQGAPNSWGCSAVATAWQRRAGAELSAAAALACPSPLTTLRSSRSHLGPPLHPPPRPAHFFSRGCDFFSRARLRATSRQGARGFPWRRPVVVASSPQRTSSAFGTAASGFAVSIRGRRCRSFFLVKHELTIWALQPRALATAVYFTLS